MFLVNLNKFDQSAGINQTLILKRLNQYSKRHLKEVRLLIQASKCHPNITRIVFCKFEENNFLIFTEFCPNGSLKQELESRSLENPKYYYEKHELLSMFVKLTECLKDLHKGWVDYADCSVNYEGFSHGDIKPENIFLTSDNQLKLGDFGFSRYIRIGQSKRIKSGDFAYKSPKFKNATKSKNSQHSGINIQLEDVWALGKTFYEIVTLKVQTDLNVLSEKEFREEIKYKFKKNKIGKEIGDVILKMLAFDYENRITMEQAYESFKALLENQEENHIHDSQLDSHEIEQAKDALLQLSLNNIGQRFKCSSDNDFSQQIFKSTQSTICDLSKIESHSSFSIIQREITLSCGHTFEATHLSQYNKVLKLCKEEIICHTCWIRSL